MELFSKLLKRFGKKLTAEKKKTYRFLGAIFSIHFLWGPDRVIELNSGAEAQRYPWGSDWGTLPRGTAWTISSVYWVVPIVLLSTYVFWFSSAS